MLAQELPHFGKCQMLYDAALTRPIREPYQLYIHRRAVDKESSPAACTYAGMHPSLRGSRYSLQGVDEVWSEASRRILTPEGGRIDNLHLLLVLRNTDHPQYCLVGTWLWKESLT